ncbi:hypothetical protein ACWC1D_12210 [Streptomyces sp. NPDC001478]
MTATVEPATDSLTSALRWPVRQALAGRAEAIRRTLPVRPDGAEERWQWWQGMTSDQRRRAALMENLDTLCRHVAGCPALGYAPTDPLPLAALEEVDGFTSEPVAELIAAYRARHRESAGRRRAELLQPTPGPMRA